MKKSKIYVFFLLLLVVGFVWVFAQTSKKEVPKQEEPTAFQTRCSICHSLKEVRTGMEKIMKEMHQKAGIEISDSSL
ncbi:MAG: hypothetical protein MUO91_07050, partial [candidate division Zixibacteria bacterium]|nr:hypothetical protein [candidate division Zixibacteria bacterium]